MGYGQHVGIPRDRQRPWRDVVRADIEATATHLGIMAFIVAFIARMTLGLVGVRGARRGAIDPAPLLRRPAAKGGPIAAWLARDYPGGGQWRDRASNRHHFKMGSSHSAEIILGPHGRLGLVGSLGSLGTGRGASAPDIAAYDITGDIEFEWQGVVTGLAAAGAQQVMIAKDGGAPNRSYIAAFVTSGTDLYLRVRLSSDGSTLTNIDSPAPLPTAMFGADLSIKITCDLDNGAGNSITTFYYRAGSAGAWTSLGATPSTVIPAIFSGSGLLAIGNDSNLAGGSSLGGFHYRAIVRNGIAGTVVFDADFTAQTTGIPRFREASSNTAVVTINPFTSARIIGGKLHLSNTAGNWAATAIPSILTGVTNLDVVARINPPLWTGDTVNRTIASSYAGTAANTAFLFQRTTSGGFIFYISHTGGTVLTGYQNTGGAAIPGTVVGTPSWVRATRNSTTGAINFYYSHEQVATPAAVTVWTQLGATITGGTGSGATALTRPLQIGGWNTNGADPMNGEILYAEIRTTIGGAAVATFDPAPLPDFARFWTDAQGNRWGLAPSALDSADTNDPLFLTTDADGQYVYLPGASNNYISTGAVVAANLPATTLSYRCKVAADDWTPGATMRLHHLTGDTALLSISTTGSLLLQVYDSTVTLRTYTSPVILGAYVVDGVACSLRADLDTTTGTATFYVDPTGGSTWISLGSTTVAAAAGLGVRVVGSARELRFGSDLSTAHFAGRVYWFEQYFDGVLFSRFDAASSVQSGQRPAGPNLLTADQASTETSTNGQALFGACTIARSTAKSSDGVASLLCTSTGAGNYGVRPNGPAPIPVTPGERITVRADVNLSVARLVNIYITYIDATGVATLDVTVGSLPALSVVPNTWQSLSGSLIIPEGVYSVISLALAIGATGAGELMYVDRFAVNAGASTGWTAGTGISHRINRATTGRKTVLVDRPIWLFGTDDYLEAPDHDDLDFTATQDMTVVFAYREHHRSNPEVMIGKKNGFGNPNVGWYIVTGAAPDVGFQVSDLVTSRYVADTTLAVPRPSGVARWVAGVRDADANNRIVTSGGVGQILSDTADDASNTLPLRIGRYSGAATSYFNGEVFGAAIFRRVLTDAQITEVGVDLLKAA